MDLSSGARSRCAKKFHFRTQDGEEREDLQLRCWRLKKTFTAKIHRCNMSQSKVKGKKSKAKLPGCGERKETVCKVSN